MSINVRSITLAGGQTGQFGSSGRGLVWNLVASLMEVLPNHSIDINYGQTGAGGYLSPQFRPNEELFEACYQYDRRPLLLIEFRMRWRQELEQRLTSPDKAAVFDLYLRLTWQFGT